MNNMVINDLEEIKGVNKKEIKEFYNRAHYLIAYYNFCLISCSTILNLKGDIDNKDVKEYLNSINKEMALMTFADIDCCVSNLSKQIKKIKLKKFLKNDADMALNELEKNLDSLYYVFFDDNDEKYKMIYDYVNYLKQNKNKE